MTPDRVWYLAYGSNLSRTRFLRYLDGGPPEPGARDCTPPARWQHAMAPLRLSFAGTSQRWDGGGVAFVDPDPGATAHVRLWDISADQFADVFAQENRLDIPVELDWEALTTEPTLDAAPGWYGRLLRLDDLITHSDDDQPVLTFTWSRPLTSNPPTAAYLDQLRTGLDECGVGTDEAGRYLSAAVRRASRQPEV